ncbi:protein of unknown function [Taphrina deformans PYCC 5710]|uniref:ATPase domain-containing protein n=1 Tax=Taphrina deformans (strain PYCC 5710 / ATCC 11124 / CBS 356.35 / IMI 108563 / JCM 9778 / NBRC 8474) TaxID=1097556 RepID=R4XC75_TAPDE|nr:protein of unknown function [Taphrina deformans PYCC 5710]|eukprot:CCG83165.1 protein of unknown function [Taphrina deformans PYCC 5710]
MNPAETIRQLNDSKDLLQKAKEQSQLKKEREKIPPKHTFAKLPGFHGREKEQKLLRKILSSNPQLNVIFGATSVGKTALLREVLASDDFHVVKFDLRISGFADLRTLYLSLCEQFQSFFSEMNNEEMDHQTLTFKHLILDLEDKESNSDYNVSVADIASLMETLQSCLLKYWEYDPNAKKEDEQNKKKMLNTKSEQSSKRRQVDSVNEKSEDESGKSRGTEGKAEEGPKHHREESFVRRPVVFLMDEAHKLPALVSDQLSLKVFLDTLLVLTKQDRLCHVLLCTSDSFFQHFLRSMNVGHHAQIMTIGDCTKEETYAYLMDELITAVPADMRVKVDFEGMYAAFGGKLSHISDYLTAWINSGGELKPYQSAIFTQAYTLLNFHLTHEQFETFSPLSTATAGKENQEDSQFSRKDLIYVMRKLVEPPYSLPYFDLCRKIGTHQADAMIKTRILDLRWTKTVSPEQEWIERIWSEDGVERPIVLPMTRIVRRAMEVVLREDDEAERRLKDD